MGEGRAWRTGIVLGAATGVGLLVGGPIVAVLLLAAVLIAAVRASQTALIGGACLGSGATLVVLIARADLACDVDCVGPDLTGWYVVGGVLLAIGGLVSARRWHSPSRFG